MARLHICKSANISYDKMRTINKLIIEIYLSPTQKKSISNMEVTHIYIQIDLIIARYTKGQASTLCRYLDAIIWHFN
jgi:hypothetical protein